MVASMQVQLLSQSHCILPSKLYKVHLQDHPTQDEKKDLSDEMGSMCSHHHWSELTPLYYQVACVGATIVHGIVQLRPELRCACMRNLATLNIELFAGVAA